MEQFMNLRVHTNMTFTNPLRLKIYMQLFQISLFIYREDNQRGMAA